MSTDLDLIGNGLDLNRRSVHQIYALMRETYAHAEAAKATGSVAPLMAFIYGNLAQTLGGIEVSGIACRKGCYFCCTSWVAASVPEMLHLLGSLPESTRVQSRISDVLTITSGRSQDERMKMQSPCPMLDAGACSVYAVRPLVCRTLVSYDASSCERFYTEFTGRNDAVSDIYVLVRNVYALALSGALKHAGLPPYFYEFNSALSTLIGRGDAEPAWLSGEDVLSGVTLDRGGDVFEDPWNAEIYEKAFA